MRIKILILLFLLFTPLFLFSQEIEYPEIPGGPTITATSTFPVFVKYIFNFVITFSGLIGFAVLVWGGILYLTSAGDATQLSEARNKIVKAVFGLVILLSSYLILSIINPELTFLTLGSAKPTTGIYLIDKNGKKFYVRDTFFTPLTSYKDIEKVEFISASSSLTAIYLYDKENFGIGEVGVKEERVVNYKIAGVLTVFEPKSIYFLWNRPGIYLCSTTTSETICPSRPIYAPNSILDLSKQNFDDKTKSIQIKKTPNLFYGAILFEKPGYVSDNACPDIFNTDIPDLDSKVGPSNNPPLKQNTLSSIIVFYSEGGRQVTGTVTFYNQPACLPGASSTEVSIQSGIWGTVFDPAWDKKVRSLRISGPGGVLLMTENRWASPYKTGSCQFFSRKDVDEEGCIKNLPNTVYDPVSTTARPSGYIIIPYFE